MIGLRYTTLCQSVSSKKIHIFSLLVVSVFTLLSMSCTESVQITLESDERNSPGDDNVGDGDNDNSSSNDFMQTQFIVSGQGIADGATEFSFTIRLKNSDGSAVQGYTPTVEISSGAGVTNNSCTQSTSTGDSTCSLSAEVPGTKLITLTNAKLGLSKSLEFLPFGRLLQKASAHLAANDIDVAFPSSVTAGNTLIACTSAFAIPSSVTDDRGNSWRLVTGGTVSNFSSSCWVAENALAGATTVTAQDGGAHILISIAEVSGIVVLNKVGFANGTGAGVLVDTSGTLETNASFVISYAADWDAPSTWAPQNGATVEQLAQVVGEASISALASQNIYTEGIHTAGFTKDNPDNNWHALVLSFQYTKPVPERIQIASAQVASSTSLTVPFDQPVNGGNTIVACVSNGDGFLNFSDNKGSLYEGVPGTGYGYMGCKIAFNANHGVSEVTFTTGGEMESFSVVIFEVSGNLKEFDFAQVGLNNNADSLTVSSVISSSQAYVFAMASDYFDLPVFTQWSVSAGYTILKEFNSGPGGYSTVLAELDLKENLSGAQEITFSATNLKPYFAGIIVGLK